MVNVVVTVEALDSEVHSGMFGGAAPDALAALIAMLATLRDGQGNTTITGLDNTQTWSGEPYPPEQFRGDAGVVDGASLLGDGSVSDMLWARPAVTILGIDCPPVVGSAAAIVPRAAARLNLRIPPGHRRRTQAQAALVDHLQAAAPWGVQVTVDAGGRRGRRSRPRSTGRRTGPWPTAMEEAYGVPMTTLGQGGSIPLCNVFADTYPDAEIDPDGRRGAAGPHPRPERERRPERDRERWRWPRRCSSSATPAPASRSSDSGEGVTLVESEVHRAAAALGTEVHGWTRSPRRLHRSGTGRPSWAWRCSPVALPRAWLRRHPRSSRRSCSASSWD